MNDRLLPAVSHKIGRPRNLAAVAAPLANGRHNPQARTPAPRLRLIDTLVKVR